jgi:threonine/homoserine/homoserine lactone efflux protein
MLDSPLIIGITLGLSAGLAPGPLQTLILSETLAHGKSGGLRVAISPLLTDAPIVALSLFFLSRIATFEPALGVLSFLGAGFLIWLALSQLKRQENPKRRQILTGSLARGVLANFLNPHPYLFWITVGGPFILATSGRGISAAPLFIFGFYTALIGAFVVFALLTDRFRDGIGDRAQALIVRILSAVLLMFAVFLLVEGFRHFGVLQG